MSRFASLVSLLSLIHISALMGACVERGVGLSFFDRKGRFLAGAYGEQRGNVLLRKTQYAWSEDTEKSLAIARNFIVGKLYNGRWAVSYTHLDVYKRQRYACGWFEEKPAG